MKFFFTSLVMVLTSVTIIAQNSISGKITDSHGNALIGATIALRNNFMGVSSNSDGSYNLVNLKDGSYVLQVSFIGYKDQLDTLAVSGNNLERNFILNKSVNNLGELVVEATRVKNEAPVAYENITKRQIAKNNNGVDIPVLLDQATSLVSSSDAGAGVGYTGMRIRGSDGTRISVSVNGIPLNDPESHGVWWVNMPDLATSTNDIQIQRGVGTSTNGAGAFGASINLNTLVGNLKAYGELSNSIGSFGTYKNSVKFGTGLLADKWIIEGRLSNIKSDGFIERASSDLKSYYLSAGYFGNNSLLKFVTFKGHEKTYQAWYGVPTDSIGSNNQYNPYTYDNEVDNYQQTHYQLHYAYDVSNNLKFNISGHYTKGLGYFEQYKGIGENTLINYYSKESLIDYGLDPVYTGNDTIYETDLIRRRWLDNDFYGAVYSVEYTKEKLDVIFGGGMNQYRGSHFGEVVWSEYASNGSIRHPYYDNDAIKNDINFYTKVNYDITNKLSAFADVQFRIVDYTFLGFDNNLSNITQNAKLSFVNPKAGVNYFIDDNKTKSVYAFYGIGNKEPNRNDYTNSTPNSRPEHETLNDFELGYRMKGVNYFLNLNLYSMDYKNQLIVTGELNDVGAAIRANVDNSYRRGIELTGGLKLLNKLDWRANATFSQNKIIEFTEFIDDWDTGGQNATVYTNTDIAFSPNLIGGSELAYSPMESEKNGNLELALITKYVGKQFIDNTSSEFAKLDSYLVNDFRLQYSIKNKVFKEIIVSGWVRNILNQQYVSNAWIYRFQSTGGSYGDIYEVKEAGDVYNLTGLFPQAGRNFLASLTLKF